LEKQLSETLLGQQLAVSRIHGDYWPANILISPDGSQVTGIVDWELSRPVGLPSMDLINLLTSTRRILEEKELGTILVEILTENCWRIDEKELCDYASQQLDGGIPGIRESLLLFWIHHISANLETTWRYLLNPVWVYNNFVVVLDYLQSHRQGN
jgi:hypothetical protein